MGGILLVDCVRWSLSFSIVVFCCLSVAGWMDERNEKTAPSHFCTARLTNHFICVDMLIFPQSPVRPKILGISVTVFNRYSPGFGLIPVLFWRTQCFTIGQVFGDLALPFATITKNQ